MSRNLHSGGIFRKSGNCPAFGSVQELMICTSPKAKVRQGKVLCHKSMTAVCQSLVCHMACGFVHHCPLSVSFPIVRESASRPTSYLADCRLLAHATNGTGMALADNWEASLFPEL